jgi:hypothetical protein
MPNLNWRHNRPIHKWYFFQDNGILKVVERMLFDPVLVDYEHRGMLADENPLFVDVADVDVDDGFEDGLAVYEGDDD